MLLLGIYQLRRDGKPGEQRQDDELYAFERTSQLVTGGIYRFIRHPLFCSLLLLTWGIACKDLHLGTLVLALLASALLYLAARRDEGGVPGLLWRGLPRVYGAQPDVYSLAVLTGVGRVKPALAPLRRRGFHPPYGYSQFSRASCHSSSSSHHSSLTL